MSVFSLEAVFAKKGDALLLHYGPWEAPKVILIDGGPSGVYRRFLKPRLEVLRQELEVEEDEPLPFEMVMVSHVDDDHIRGILDLFDEVSEAKRRRKPLPYKIKTLWHNSFDDLVKNDRKEIISRMAATAASTGAPGGLALPEMSRESKAVVASTRQGRLLRKAARFLRVPSNKPFTGLVMAPAVKKISLGHGLSFTVIGPLRDQVVKFQKRWAKDLKKILEDEKKSAEASAFEDESPFNLASICVLAKMKGKSMLLTGDARGDFIISGLEAAKVLKKTKPLKVDILKVPHHGSDRNVEDSFFERIQADHYVFSGDGEHGNPERETLEMLQRARGNRRYTVHFTFTKDAHTKERNAKRKKALKRVAAWVRQKPANCEVVYRGNKKADLSLLIDLEDPFRE